MIFDYFQKGLDLVNPKKKQKKKGYVNSGVLYISQCNVTMQLKPAFKFVQLYYFLDDFATSTGWKVWLPSPNSDPISDQNM